MDPGSNHRPLILRGQRDPGVSQCPLAVFPEEAFEGIAIAPQMATFYLRHAAADIDTVAVVRDCISPVPDIYLLAFTPELIEGSAAWQASTPPGGGGNHIKAYHDAALIFSFHDAFHRTLRVSGRIPEETVRDFCATQGARHAKEATKQRDPEQLRRFLPALENPASVRVEREPLWKRIWYFVTRR